MGRNGTKADAPIKRYRIRRGLTQQELADELRINRITLVKLESYQRRVGRELAQKISRCTGQTLGQVIDEYAGCAR